MFPSGQNPNGTLADIGDVVGGATPSKKKPEYYCANGIGWITPRDLSNTNDKFIAHGADDITEAGYASCSAKLLPKGSVLFSSRAPIGYVAIAAGEVTTNQGFKSVVPKTEFGTAFTYCFLVRNKQRIADMGAGTTFPEVSGRMMKLVQLAVPDRAACAEFNSFAEPLLKQQESLERENRELAALRDALLPKLMSGEIDVSKVDLTQLNSHLSNLLCLSEHSESAKMWGMSLCHRELFRPSRFRAFRQPRVDGVERNPRVASVAPPREPMFSDHLGDAAGGDAEKTCRFRRADFCDCFTSRACHYNHVLSAVAWLIAVRRLWRLLVFDVVVLKRELKPISHHCA